MAAAVGKYAAKKMLSKQLNQYKDKQPAGQYDPYYEYRTDPRTNKKKKYKKQIPSYIPAHDADVLASVRKTAYRLDCSLFNFLGVRFGVSSVIGLIPVIGDGADGVMALNTVRKCMKVDGGLPQSVLLQMLLWVVVDFVVGLVPFVGDILDASIKANSKNCRILEEHLDKRYKPEEVRKREKAEREAARAANRKYDAPAPATVYEDMSDDEKLPQYEEAAAGGLRTGTAGGGARPGTAGGSRPATRPGETVASKGPVKPAPVRTADERRNGQKPLGTSGSKRDRRNDVEAGRGGR